MIEHVCKQSWNHARRVVFPTKKNYEAKTGSHLPIMVSNDVHSATTRCNPLSTNEALLCSALLLVFSNHLPASLLSPELCLLTVVFAESVEGGLALSLA